MNQQQRDEIREKHYYGKACHIGAFPCDVIAILDAWEAKKANDFTDEELKGIALIFGEFGAADSWAEWRGVSVKAKSILEAREENQ